MTELKKILLVEDDPGVAELIMTILEGEDYEVALCTDGRAVRQEVRAQPPALILLDLWIPGLDGERVTRALKGSAETRHIPVVIISAQNNLAAVAERIGADGFIAKPFDLAELSALVKKYAS